METSYHNAERMETNRKKNRFLLMIIIILLLIIILLVGIKLLNGGSTQGGMIERENRAETGILPGMTTEEIQERLDMIVEEGMFNVSMNGTVRFADGYSEGDVNIENIDANHYSCTVEIYLKNTDECILKTGLIDPGQYVKRLSLDRPLVDGVFDCTAVFTAYDPDTVQSVGKVNMDIIILVGE